MWLYRYVPDVAQWLIFVLVLWVAHARGMSTQAQARTARQIQDPGHGGDLFVSLILAAASMDGWVIARFIGGRGIDSTWQDPVFDVLWSSISSSFRFIPN